MHILGFWLPILVSAVVVFIAVAVVVSVVTVPLWTQTAALDGFIIASICAVAWVAIFDAVVAVVAGTSVVF